MSRKVQVPAKDLTELNAKAKEVHGLDLEIMECDKENMKKALALGKILVWGKDELKRLKLRGRFENWIKSDCGIPYKRGYNYKKVYEAAQKDASIKRMGLTEAYLLLKLVKRAPKADVSAEGAVNSSDASTAPPATPIAPVLATVQTQPTVPAAKHRKIAKYDVIKHTDAYLLEVDADWQDMVLEVFADIENCMAVLKDGGLLLRLKQTDVGEVAGIEAVR